MTLDLSRSRARIAELLAEHGIPSAAIGVLRDGEIAEFATGVKDVETREPATTDTVYQIGSMTKTWTALAFLRFVDEGRADLDAPVQTYLPDFAVADSRTSAALTARHLLQHTHGIEETYGDPGADDDVYARMVAGMADARQVFPLGHTHGYSPALGYAVLARIMEVLDGKPWDAVLRARLFDPMGLTSTNSRHEEVDQTRAATGHLLRSPGEGPFVTPIDHLPRAFGPGGNITSTIREVLGFAHVLLNEGVAPNGTQIVSAASLREMTASRVPVPDPYLIGPEWALGLVVCDWHGETVYATDGSTIGQNARLRLLPDSGTAIAVLINGSPRESFHRAAFTAILSDLGTTTLPDPPTPNPTLRLDPHRYEGVYSGPEARYEVSADTEKLYLTMVLDPMRADLLQQPERLRYELQPITETHFLMPPIDPAEDTGTIALYDFTDGTARYLHTNARANPRLDTPQNAVE
ncbi:serine hydrolase domain-containing protein [Nocardia asteroides]|uniref:serine hydrolase domain-containing protein n=1 Tax=Nocardia asteroides TaxID=1824 RepID=UPI001E4DAFC5|nr:serine hydrolase domain-containing protein [Nocardia asteroides]UGT57120.1 beta-lactamase family protein [Nocardia asteroides]